MQNNTTYIQIAPPSSPVFFDNTICNAFGNKALPFIPYTLLLDIESVLIIVANVLVATIILSYKAIRHRHSSKIFLSLQLTHVGLAGSQLVFNHMHWNTLGMMVGNVALLQMFLSLIILSLERLFYIKFPYWYERWQDHLPMISILSTWFITAAFAVTCVMVDLSQRELHIMSSALIVLACTILSTSSGVIFFTAKRHVETIRRNSVLVVNEVQPIKQKKRRCCKKRRCLTVSFALVTSYILAWLPFLVHNILSLTGLLEASPCHRLSWLVTFIALLNSIFDPVIFVTFNRNMKRELCKTFHILRRSVDEQTEMISSRPRAATLTSLNRV